MAQQQGVTQGRQSSRGERASQPLFNAVVLPHPPSGKYDPRRTHMEEWNARARMRGRGRGGRTDTLPLGLARPPQQRRASSPPASRLRLFARPRAAPRRPAPPPPIPLGAYRRHAKLRGQLVERVHYLRRCGPPPAVAEPAALNERLSHARAMSLARHAHHVTHRECARACTRTHAHTHERH